MSERKTRRGLSCVRCRARKVRCDNQFPCGGCAKERVECVRVHQDRRKERYSQAFVDSLQAKANRLELVVAAVRLALDPEGFPTVSEASTPQLDRGVYGPTSAFSTEQIQPYDEQDLRVIGNLNQDAVVVEAIKLFFTWQYPGHYAYIDRELFLHEFLNPQPQYLFCSLELVYALAALGASISDDGAIRLRTSEFYSRARAQLLGTAPHGKFDTPLLALVQALLTLSFYDVCHGNNSLLWMLSGLGIRMGFDVGFHLHPELWYIGSRFPPSPERLATRLRVYWGCYIADHFFSLVFGRPTQMKRSDSLVPRPEDVEAISEYLDYMFPTPPGEQPYLGVPLSHMIDFIHICNKRIDDIFALGANQQQLAAQFAAKLVLLKQFNLESTQWKQTLPSSLQWTQRNPTGGDHPTKLMIRLYYYIALICINRPFLEQLTDPSDDVTDPRNVVFDAIEEVLLQIGRFRDVHGLARCQVHVVYALVFSILVLMAVRPVTGTIADRQPLIDVCMTYLQECGQSWNLAVKWFAMIQRKMQVPPPPPLPRHPDLRHNSPSYYPDEIVAPPPQGMMGQPMYMTGELLVNEWDMTFPNYHDGQMQMHLPHQDRQ